ncbi:Acetyl-CoA:oxalate CoA-transferase [Cupriavidus pinatubonensis]|uniref:Acetyl-CoA:oxalate CoA-transferase n=2 Tax=Cupriavidus pinatubonensis TaxID=248026 RepID=A0ABM8Y212_9BURK|nr:Acetyl-CoA:oxalate CoA-transferase [Cupriavidus pinatubonensis]
MALSLGTHAAGGKKAGRLGSGIGFIAPSRAYMATDGYLMVSCANDHLFGKLCVALDHPEWATDARFATNAARLQHRAALDALLESRLLQHPRATWQQRLRALGVPSAPVQEVEEVFQCEQVQALAILQSAAEDEMPVIGLPLSFDGERPPALSPAGDLGQANQRLGAHRKTEAMSDGPNMASETSA